TSAVQYMKEEQPEYELIKKFLQKQYKEYYSKRFLFKSAEYTAFHFPFIVKEIARNVLRLKIDDRETIEEKMKGKAGEEEKAKKKLPYSVLSKVISLLEENMLYSDDGRYIHKIRNKLNQNLEYKVIFLNNSLFGEIPLSLPDTLSEWEVVLSGEDSTSLEEQPTGETEKVMITEPVNSSSPNETEFPEAPKEESEEEKMYNYFKTLLIVKLSSVEEIAENRNKKKEVVFKDMKEKFPVFDSIMLTSFLDRIKKERETEIIEEMEQGDEDGEGDLS
ncbi:MAG TPA: hypothetical protein P5150_09575, partial [Candidatus Ratteibacteria bacterium]|nr:hypothetical protein [Candidatus Ratteibacteria bacterium]